MINDVINETEQSKEDENSVSKEKTTENSAAEPAEETDASREAPETLTDSSEPAAALPDSEIANEATASAATESPIADRPEAADEPAAPEEPAPSQETAAPDPENALQSPETAAADQPSGAQAIPAAKAEENAASPEPEAAEMDFGAILEEFEQDQEVFHIGKLVEGTVVGISDHGVLIDFGYKSEGLVASDEFSTPDGALSIKDGDKVEVIIRSIYSGDAPPTLSYLDALRRKSWDSIEIAYNEEQPVTAYVVAKTKGGLRIDINGVEAFLPGSQVDSRPVRNLDAYLGKELEAKVIKFSRKRNNIVISRKVLTDQVLNKQKAETLSKIEEGYVVDGVVKNLTEYGAFVDLGGIDGLLHVTDMSWGRVQNPNDMFKVNDQVQVKILKLDREREKVSLGFKQLLPDPWSTVVEVYPVDSTVKGVVSSVTDYGAFVELEPGVEGLVHVSEMSWSKRTKNPKKLVRGGQEVEVQVLGIDTDDRRISLGMKQLQENPWDTIGQRYQVGSKVTGRVRNLTDFGAFIEIEDGIDGLVHVSDISHSKKIKHPKDVLKKDQEVEAVVTNVDVQGQRLSLSIKELTPSTWDAFVESHRPGDVVKGKVSRFAGFGVFVELGSDLEGLCHISELADERVEKPEDVVSIGQELDFKILRIEHDVQKIGLSARAVGKSEEPAVDAKMYSSEAKSGMASLGELINLKRGGPDEGAEESPEEPKLSKKERRAKKAQETADTAESGEDSDVAAESPETEAAAAGDVAAETEESASAVEEAKSPEDTAEAAPEESAAETVETKSEADAEAAAATEDESPKADAEAAAATEDESPKADAEAAAATEDESPKAEAEAAAATEDESPKADAEAAAATEDEAPKAEAEAVAATEDESPKAEAEAAAATEDESPKAEATEEIAAEAAIETPEPETAEAEKPESAKAEKAKGSPKTTAKAVKKPVSKAAAKSKDKVETTDEAESSETPEAANTETEEKSA